MTLSDPQLAAALAPYGVRLVSELADSIRKYIHLLLVWNQKINLTTIRDPIEIVERHFGESMFAIHAVPIQHGRLADVGSGAGFPGMALKIACPALQVTLIEANARKATFLLELKRQLNFTGIEIVRERYENVGDQILHTDFLTARALGNFSTFLPWARNPLRPSGKVLLWLGAGDAERMQSTAGWVWQDPIFMPRSEKRVLLIGAPEST